ncbi:MAG: hypothetical protein N2512_11940 [Armatimonadetes bacterium]|nr:hypothetical protein [Armatimonadota bacterium]
MAQRACQRMAFGGICLWLLLVVTTARAEDPVSRLLKRWGLFQDLQLSGTNTFTLQNSSVEGSVNSYLGQRWDTGNFIAQTSLHAEGSIYKEFGFQADFSSSGYGPSYSRWLLGYVGHDTAVYYGDLNIDLGSNEFAAFRKTLRGWQIDQALPKGGLLRYFESEEKGLVRRQTFPGNDTSGPFFLTYTPIIEGSEVVKVNEEVQRFGKDYRLDYETGELRFEPVDGPPKIIPRTATVSVSYQSYGYGGAPGALSGLRVEMPLGGKRALLGITRLTERRGGRQGDTVGYHEDIYQGSGTTGPFDTSFRPIIANGARVTYKGRTQTIEQALVVLVDNVEQKETVDYDVNRYLGRILFRRAVPPTSLVIVRYYYDLSARTSSSTDFGGDLWAFDLAWAVTPNLQLKYDYASSQPGAPGAASGAAQKLLATYRTGPLRLTAQWRDIDPTFDFLNSVGFYRHERGLQYRAEYELAQATTLYWESSNLKTSTGYSFGYSGYLGGEGFGAYDPYGTPGTYPYGAYASAVAPLQSTTTTLDVTARRTNYGIRFAKPRWPGIELDVQKMENVSGSGSRSSYGARQLRVQYFPTGAPYSLSLSWSDNEQSSLQPGGTQTGTATSTRASTRQFQAAVTYTPSQRLSFSWNLGTVATDAGTESRSSSRTQQFAARWMPSDKLSLSLTHSAATSTGKSVYYGGGGGGGGGYYPWNPGGNWGSYTGTYGLTGQAYVTQWPVTWPYIALPAQDDGDDGDNTRPIHYADKNTTVNLSYQPSARLSLDFSAGRRTYRAGNTGYLADSDQDFRNVSLMWQVSDALALQAAYGTDDMLYLSEDGGRIANKMLSLGLSFRPPDSRLGAALTMTRQTGSSPTYVGFGRGQRQIVVATDLSDLTGRLYYRLGESSELYLQLGTASYSGGYAAFDKQTIELGLERSLSDNARMTFGYRWIRNLTDESALLPAYLNVSQQSQDYVASTVLLSVNINFTSGLAGRSGFRSPTSATGYYGAMGYGSFGTGSLTTFGGYRSDLFGQQMGFRGGRYGGAYGSGLGDLFGDYGYGSSEIGIGGPFGTASGYGAGYGQSYMPGAVGSGPGTTWTGRGPQAPRSPTERGGPGAIPTDPWDLVGDAVSLY